MWNKGMFETGPQTSINDYCWNVIKVIPLRKGYSDIIPLYICEYSCKYL